MPRRLPRPTFQVVPRAIVAGRSERVGPSRRHQQCLWRGLFHTGAQPLELRRGLLLTRGHGLEQRFITGALGRLPDQRPGDIDFACYEIEVVQVTQQAKSSRARATEEVVVQSLRFLRGFLTVAVDEGRELRGVLIALRGQLLAEDADVRFITMSRGNLAKRISQHQLRAMNQSQIVREVHDLNSPRSSKGPPPPARRWSAERRTMPPEAPRHQSSERGTASLRHPPASRRAPRQP